MKVFQIIGNMCYWCTPYKSVGETVGKYPPDCKFVEAPDYVHESWGYIEVDNDGNEIPYEERFIKPETPEGWLYDESTGTFYPESEVAERLERSKNDKQNENKAMFAEYLRTHPLVWTDGKTYGVTFEDQTEIQLNLSQYMIQLEAGVEDPILEWHAHHEACTKWTYENLSVLAMSIANYIYPQFQKMNEYKAAIYAAETESDVKAIVLDYRTEEEINSESKVEEETSEQETTESQVVEEDTSEPKVEEESTTEPEVKEETSEPKAEEETTTE